MPQLIAPALRQLAAALWIGAVFAAHAEPIASPSIGDDKAAAIKGTRKVAIAEFGVEFYTQLTAEVRKNSGAAARYYTSLAGVGAEDFQAATDKAYADTVAALQAAGFEVVDKSTVQADPAYQALAAKYGAASPYKFVDSSIVKSEPNISLVYAPSGMQAFFSSSMIRGDFGQRTEAQNFSRGVKDAELAKSLGATVLHVHYLLGFAQPYADKNNALFNSSWAHAGAKFGNNLFPKDSEWQFVTAEGPRTFTTSTRLRHSGAVFIDKPFVSAVDLYGVQDATNSADKGSDAATETTTALSKLGSLFGGGGGLGSAQKTVRSEAKPSSVESWRQDVDQLLSQATQAFAQALQAAR